MKVKEESEKVSLKLNIQKQRSWHLVPSLHGKYTGKQWKSVRLYFWGLQNHCSHEIKRCLLLGRKAMTNLDSILKSRDITLLTKIHLVKAMVFPVVMYGGESWTVKKAERQRIDAFELRCWKRLLRVPWTARRFNLFILKEMATHSKTLAWKLPWTEEAGGLQSMGSLRVWPDWVTSLSLFTFMHWRRKWQPTPVFLPGESQGQGSLVGCCLWGRTELDTTKAT